jgi:hypothetical protein
MVRRRTTPMGIKLSIEIVSPLGPEDKDLQTGVSIMTLAIANHELARERFPGTFPDDVAEDAVEAMPCMVERDLATASESSATRAVTRTVASCPRPRA